MLIVTMYIYFLHVCVSLCEGLVFSCPHIFNPCLTCSWLQQLCLHAVSCSRGVSRPPGGCPKTSTGCCPLWDCSWPVHSGASVWVFSRNQHSAGPGDQRLELEMEFGNTRMDGWRHLTHYLSFFPLMLIIHYKLMLVSYELMRVYLYNCWCLMLFCMYFLVYLYRDPCSD